MTYTQFKTDVLVTSPQASLLVNLHKEKTLKLRHYTDSHSSKAKNNVWDALIRKGLVTREKELTPLGEEFIAWWYQTKEESCD